jgi:predicted aldo/keto reductase-like oxidoreductase
MMIARPFSFIALAAKFLPRSFAASTMSPWSLNDWARSAIAEAQEEHRKSNEPDIVDPNSNRNTANQISISIAKKFLTRASPKFLKSDSAQDEDRLVKVGRSVTDLVSLVGEKDNCTENEEETLKLGLGNVVEQCDILASENLNVPKKRFGKTGINMPVVTLGCMRFQQSWNGSKEVNPEVQANLVKLLHYAITKLGINHIETARGYGTSEEQLGKAFAEVFKMGVKREDLIIQTKVNAMPAKAFRATLEKSFKLLGLDYIDLFSFHGLNMEFAYKLIFDNEGDENLIDIIKEYQAAGKIKHIGFSTHGQPELVRKCIETDEFEYVNLHYHAFGSYTATGGGQFGGHLENVRLMNDKDMGVFIISPYDKGGRLYAPSNKLRSLTLPDLEPIQYGGLWLFNHGEMDETNADIHTFTVGAARPSDLDEPAVAAYLYANRKKDMMAKVEKVSKRLREAEVEALGEEWLNNWYQGVTNCLTEDDAYNFGQIIQIYNLIKSFGMVDYGIDRYGMFDSNVKNWNFKKPTKENISKMKIGWGYTPGIPTPPGKDYSALLSNVPIEHKARVLEALEFVFDYCSKNSDKKDLVVPDEWKTAYDMRPWTAFPERG